jgi:hypothetical protein
VAKKLASFLNIKKKSQATWSREFFEKFQQKFHTPRKKVTSGFGVVSNFLLLKSPYLANKFSWIVNM